MPDLEKVPDTSGEDVKTSAKTTPKTSPNKSTGKALFPSQ